MPTEILAENFIARRVTYCDAINHGAPFKPDKTHLDFPSARPIGPRGD